MDHPWRPHPIQGNICPTCSISHFPFCPPHPHPHPHPSAYSVPNFDPNRCPINISRPNYDNSGDPYHDPGYNYRNPSSPHVGNFGTVNRGPYSMQNPGYGDVGYMGNDYSNVSDRSSKRLRFDGAYPGSYGAEGNANLSSRLPVEDNVRRLNFVRDHGGPNSGFCFGEDMNPRGYALESSEFGRNVDGGHPRNPSDFVLRPPSNMEMSNSPGMGYNFLYQREEMEYQAGYGSRYSMKRSASDVEYGTWGNKVENNDRQRAPYGQLENPPDGHSTNNYHSNYGNSHGSSKSYCGSNMESLHPNNASMHYDPRSNMPTVNHYNGNHPPIPSTGQQPGQLRYDYGSPHQFSDVSRPPPIEGYKVPVASQNVSTSSHYGVPNMNYQGGYGSSVSEMGHLRASQEFDVHPPLPASPPPPLPMEPPVCWPAENTPLSPPPRVSSSLFPVRVDSSAPVLSAHAPISQSHSHTTPHPSSSQRGHAAPPAFQGDPQGTLTSFGHYLGAGQTFPSKNNLPDKPKIIDAATLFKAPHRTSRPDHFVIILRGLPGSGKSYLAKMLRDLEVEHGGNAPRIHSMDDYFMTEVEKVEENEASKSSVRVKKPVMKKVLEYCYEPEMEEAYRSSMLKSFKKTLEEGSFTFVIVDDRNLRVADFAQFWATAKRSGYEVYVLEAPYKDPAGCTARNVHGFTQVDVEKMAAQWEEAPPLYLQMDVKSLFHGDDLKESSIEEVDMDTEDGDDDGGLLKLDDSGAQKILSSSAGDLGACDIQKDERNFEAEVGHPLEEVKDLGSSKWSSKLDDDDNERTEVLKGKANILSGMLRTYGKEGKSVHWGDQSGHTGFSIGAVKKANLASLVIGPGAGYNMKSNPLPNEDAKAGESGGTKKQHSMFQERLRAEQESFKAVFDRRRHRIGGLEADDD